MQERLENFVAQLRRDLRQRDRQDTSVLYRFFVRCVVIAYAVIRDLAEGQLTLRAMSLVYSTLLSFAPLIAVSFSVLKAFGVHNQLEPALQNLLKPLGDKGSEISTNVLKFVENIQVGVLGSLGLALLFYTVVSLMQKVETSFNYTWRVTQSRSIAQRFSDYLSVLMIGPVLIFSALGVTGSLLNSSIAQELSQVEPFGSALHAATSLLPYVLIIAAFTFVYSFIPNTKVQLTAAFSGAVISGILWETLGWGFASFVVSSAKYTAIYSAFASLMFFLIWLHLSWLVLLIGASIAFYVQHPDYTLVPRGELQLSFEQEEKIGLAIMCKITRDFYREHTANSAGQLAAALHLAENITLQVLNRLEQSQLLRLSNDNRPKYLPGQPLEEITVKMVIDAIRRSHQNSELAESRFSLSGNIEQLFADLDRELAQQLGDTPLKQLAMNAEHIGAVDTAALTPDATREA